MNDGISVSCKNVSSATLKTRRWNDVTHETFYICWKGENILMLWHTMKSWCNTVGYKSLTVTIVGGQLYDVTHWIKSSTNSGHTHSLPQCFKWTAHNIFNNTQKMLCTHHVVKSCRYLISPRLSLCPVISMRWLKFGHGLPVGCRVIWRVESLWLRQANSCAVRRTLGEQPEIIDI